MKTYVVALTDGKTLSSVAHAVAGMLDEQENLPSRILTKPNGEYVIQAYSRCGHILRWIGLDQQLSITLTPIDKDHFRVKTVCSRWLLSRGILFLTGLLIVCWPLAVTSAAGAIRGRLLERQIHCLLWGNGPPKRIRVVYRE